ncbi:RNA pseudouridylate synthase, group 1 [hydrothermal vent metagenome]|uniref:RNA pseudouridylate synthase, group 1 n=1 Tax=hydrothermal vent metagenome TaxID=652676 RepID=A0A3B1DLU2_9ZZZZ
MTLSSFPLKILYQDNHLIAVYKPHGLATQADTKGGPALLDQTRQWIKTAHNKPGNVFLGLVHRLDKPVSGVVLFAKTSKAASRLAEQFRERKTKKTYRAIICGTPIQENGSLVQYLRKENSLKATVFPRPTPGAKKSVLSYTLIEKLPDTSILEIILETGRFHQIRAQLAFMGNPILGDVKYGARSPLPDRQIALYAQKLVVTHPISKDEITLESPPPPGWPFENKQGQ